MQGRIRLRAWRSRTTPVAARLVIADILGVVMHDVREGDRVWIAGALGRVRYGTRIRAER